MACFQTMIPTRVRGSIVFLAGVFAWASINVYRPLAAPQADTGPAAIQEKLKRIAADLFSGADRVNESIQELKAILAADPGSAEAHFFLGIAYGRLGSTELMGEASAEFRQALSLNPNFVQARYYLAQVYLNFGRVQRAREELDVGRVDDALDALRHGNQIDPARPDIRIRLARAYRSKGLLSQAEEQLQLAESAGRRALAPVASDQVDSDLYLEQGLVKLQQGRL